MRLFHLSRLRGRACPGLDPGSTRAFARRGGDAPRVLPREYPTRGQPPPRPPPQAGEEKEKGAVRLATGLARPGAVEVLGSLLRQARRQGPARPAECRSQASPG